MQRDLPLPLSLSILYLTEYTLCWVCAPIIFGRNVSTTSFTTAGLWYSFDLPVVGYPQSKMNYRQCFIIDAVINRTVSNAYPFFLRHYSWISSSGVPSNLRSIASHGASVKVNLYSYCLANDLSLLSESNSAMLPCNTLTKTMSENLIKPGFKKTLRCK